ncbi:MAG: trpA [Acidimicrobiia bacterium]|nr:trpA [Acidimicrobiia bacterium]
MKLESQLRAKRDAGRKLLVPYITAGVRADWCNLVRGMADAGADAIEIGIPFSDPMIDGPIIQQASQMALDLGVTPASVLDAVHDLEVDVPLVVMTYCNIPFRAGYRRFASELVAAGVDGCIVPDLPLEESAPWCEAADAVGVETVMLAAPTAPDDRLPLICERVRGFVYAVGLVGITGERAELASSSLVIAKRLKAITDKPVIVGIGVSTAEQAAEVCQVADGVVVGSAVVRRIVEGADIDEVLAFVRDLRAGLDRA